MKVSGRRRRVWVRVGIFIPDSRASSDIDRMPLRSIAHRIADQIISLPFLLRFRNFNHKKISADSLYFSQIALICGSVKSSLPLIFLLIEVAERSRSSIISFCLIRFSVSHALNLSALIFPPSCCGSATIYTIYCLFLKCNPQFTYFYF